MSDDVNVPNQEIPAGEMKSDEDWIKMAMDSLKSQNTEEKEEEPSVIETTEDQSQEEEKKDETADEEKAEPQVEEKTEEKKEGVKPNTEKPESKPIYTLEEIEAEIKLHGDLAHLDSSRLSAEGKLIQASMQRGLTPKLQEAAELRKERDNLIQKIRAEEEKRAKAEAERLYQEEKELLGEEQANLLKRVRDLEESNRKKDEEREFERRVYLEQQNALAAERFHVTFQSKAKDYGLPTTEEMEATVMDRVVTENSIRQLKGEQFITAEDAMRMVSDNISKNLKSLIDANPKLKEAIENEYKEKFSRAKPNGPTVIKSSSSGGGKSEIKPTAAAHDKLLEKDIDAWAIQEALANLRKPKE